MQIIFYKTSGDRGVEIARTPMVAKSIFMPIPQANELITINHIQAGRETYVVDFVEYVYADTTDLNVSLYFVKVYLRAWPAKQSKVSSSSPQ